MRPTDFSYALTKYLSIYLPGQYNASQHTILAYRDSFKLLLRYAETDRSINPERLTLAMIDVPFIYGFLNWLEGNGNAIPTQNQRLAAMKAFFRWLQRDRPDMMSRCQEVMGIPLKRTSKATVGYLSVDAIKALLAAPDASEKYGLRDLAILCLLYDSGARVSEIAGLTPQDLRLDAIPIINLFGKGRKMRQCPLSAPVAENLRRYLSAWKLNTPEKSSVPLFLNHKDERIGRAGITYVLKKYISAVKTADPTLISVGVSPHMLRHSKAMHLLQAGVNLIYIKIYSILNPFRKSGKALCYARFYRV